MHDPAWRPPHRYVPGASARHPDALFDWIKILPEHPDLGDLEASPAWQMGRAFAQEGYFWEAHEVWEAVWLVCPPAGPDKLAVQGVIQLANAALKLRMDRPVAAGRLRQMGMTLLSEARRRGARLLLPDHEFTTLAAASDDQKGNIMHNNAEIR